MSDFDKLIASMPKDFKLDLSKMPEIISLEKKYNALGSKRLDELLKYSSPTQWTGGEKSLFIFGYSECGQTMDAKIKELENELEGNKVIIALTPSRNYLKDKIKELEAKLFNEKSHYETLYETYCLAFDYIAHILGKPNTDEAMEEFKKWVTRKD